MNLEEESGPDSEPSQTVLAVYSALATRRISWDTMLWQVPVLSMTGQAFLLTIALGQGSTHVARYISSSLSVVAASTSLILMAGHRRSELADAQSLQEFEENHSPNFVVHGLLFSQRRRAIQINDSTLNAFEKCINMLSRAVSPKSSFPYWMLGISMFGLAGLTALLLTAFAPRWL